jgi:hypothetical protein
MHFALQVISISTRTIAKRMGMANGTVSHCYYNCALQNHFPGLCGFNSHLSQAIRRHFSPSPIKAQSADGRDGTARLNPGCRAAGGSRKTGKAFIPLSPGS